MFRKNSHLNILQTRKRLLLAESEVNRAELSKELDALKGEIARVKKHIATAGSIVSSAAVVATAASLFSRRFGRSEKSDSSAKTPWVSAALDGVRIGTLLFSKIKSFFRKRE